MLWFAGLRSIHWATPARAVFLTTYMLTYLAYSRDVKKFVQGWSEQSVYFLKGNTEPHTMLVEHSPVDSPLISITSIFHALAYTL